MHTVAVAKTDVGNKRTNNEDAFLADADLGLYVVADGMGGHAAGEVASREAIQTIRDNLLASSSYLEDFKRDPGNESADELRGVIDRAVRAAAYRVFGLSQIDPDRKGMGTTLSMLLVTPAAAFLAHVGDSRIYMLRSGKVKMVTSDHTYVAAMMEAGKMTAEEAARSRYSNLLVRAVGSHDYVDVDTRILRYRVGDVFLLCSDGLSGYLKEAEIPRRVKVDDLPGSIERLIKLALDRGGKDNITAILVRIDP
ncbi:MAG TPA: protein phosphatase 2C domain-containing protein [Myxococcota bacterium]|nr:protein phosphatase 2C domain-containing protein [Myxococcota bacterium]